MHSLARQRRKFLKAGDPVISMDTEKKELIGLFKNPGHTLRHSSLEVLETDFTRAIWLYQINISLHARIVHLRDSIGQVLWEEFRSSSRHVGTPRIH
jgi:hypothetical protein